MSCLHGGWVQAGSLVGSIDASSVSLRGWVLRCHKWWLLSGRIEIPLHSLVSPGGLAFLAILPLKIVTGLMSLVSQIET